MRSAVDAHLGALDGVDRPSVVHMDLWPGNLLVGDDDRVSGITDTERTLWGDPLFDLIGMKQLDTAPPSVALLEGDTAAGGVLAAQLRSRTGPTRLRLYRLYSSLILIIEVVPRGYSQEWADRQSGTARQLLDLALQQLAESD